MITKIENTIYIYYNINFAIMGETSKNTKDAVTEKACYYEKPNNY